MSPIYDQMNLTGQVGQKMSEKKKIEKALIGKKQ
tara:strand:+ start:1699 stop:1800 length:102 start_codon:yes stop_codon:yes gene_type:complete